MRGSDRSNDVSGGTDDGSEGRGTRRPVGDGGSVEALDEASERSVDSTADDPEATGSSDGTPNVTAAGHQGEDVNIAATALLNTLPQPAFLLDDQHRVAGWNREMELLTGVDRSNVLGEDDVGRFFADGRDRTLADAVVENPDSADQDADVERSSRDQTAYEIERELENADGETLHVHCVATLIYQHDAFQGVVQLVQDNTTVIRKHEAMSELVAEVTETADELEDGNLSARVHFTDEQDVLDEEVLEIVDAINAIADSTQTIVDGLGDEIEEIAEAAAEIADATADVDGRIGDQNDSIREITDEFQDVSATMEEIAATADEVAAAAEQAQSAAQSGAEASDSAKSEMESVVEVCDGLVETVTQLEQRMEAIDEVVEVIADVAEETNLLALNANIEAARAGEDGAGFGVVADEVKSLANETKQNAEDISERIGELQERTGTTVRETEAVNDRVRSASTEIDAVIGSLDEITDVVDEAASGITQVAEANDDQSASIEELTATAQEVSDRADEIERKIGTITEEAIQQRDSVDEMVDGLAEFSASDTVDAARADGSRPGSHEWDIND